MKLAALFICLLAPLLAGCGIMEAYGIAQSDRAYVQKVAECKTDSLDFQFAVPDASHRGYWLVLGIPKLQTNVLSFSGELTLHHGSDSSVGFVVSSSDVKPYDYLITTNLHGYCIVTPTKLSFMTPKQIYNAHVRFTQRPPDGSSLWFIATP